MNRADEKELSRIFNPSSRESVIAECLAIASDWLLPTELSNLEQAWISTRSLYTGFFPGYLACTTEYHDLSHTCDVFGATIRMIDGAISSGRDPSPELRGDLAVAALLHDAGYIQEASDLEGTGAKYTKTHVARSIAFTLTHRDSFDLTEERAKRVGRLIAGTDLGLNFDDIPYVDEEEKFAGKLLAAADLLGQMADRTYLEKLVFLYYEFKEAGYPGYDTEFDILRKTLGFYEMTKKRLFGLLGETMDLPLRHFASRYGVEQNLYLESIERQIAYLQTIIDDNSVNFRKKLKRLDLESITASHATAQ